MRGEVVITLGENSWPGKITLDATIKIETAAGLPITQLVSLFRQGGNMTILTYINVLKNVADASGKIVKEDAIKRAIEDVGLVNVIEVVGEILALILLPVGAELPEVDEEGNVIDKDGNVVVDKEGNVVGAKSP